MKISHAIVAWLLGSILVVIGAFLKVRHVGGADGFLLMGMLVSFTALIFLFVRAWRLERSRK